jgi:hypothetical protein
MAVRVKPVTLWRIEVDNTPGALERVLSPLASAKADLQVVMGYRFPNDRSRAAIEIAPVSGARSISAAQAAGLSEAGIPALRVEGDNRPGLGHSIASALASAGINMDFLVAQVSGRQHSTVIGFDSDADARAAAPIIKKAATAPRQPATAKTAVRRRRAKSRARRARKV